MRKLFNAFIWFRRCLHSRGFGVQSPSAYWFIRYVINEHYPYYAYSELEQSMIEMCGDRRKFLELYFRLSNFCQASNWLDFCCDSDACQCYVNAACSKTKFVNSACVDDLDAIRQIGVARISASGESRKYYDDIISCANIKTVLVIEDINCNSEAKRFWQQVVDDERTGVTFDLYFCGIVFFDLDKFKCNYVVNF